LPVSSPACPCFGGPELYWVRQRSGSADRSSLHLAIFTAGSRDVRTDESPRRIRVQPKVARRPAAVRGVERTAARQRSPCDLCRAAVSRAPPPRGRPARSEGPHLGPGRPDAPRHIGDVPAPQALSCTSGSATRALRPEPRTGRVEPVEGDLVTTRVPVLGDLRSPLAEGPHEPLARVE